MTQPLDYAPPPAPKRPGMWLGMVTGVAISAVWYGGLMAGKYNANPYALFLPMSFKFVGGITALFFQRWQRFGLGLLISIPVVVFLAFAILFSLCFLGSI